MYVANAWKQTKRSNPRDDSPLSAGVGKLPSQTVTNKSELKVLGDRMGWTVRPLTAAEIRGGMSGQEQIWHELMNSENYKAAFTIEENQRNNKQNMAGWAVKRMFEDQATPEELAAAVKVTQNFGDRFPQGQFAT